MVSVSARVRLLCVIVDALQAPAVIDGRSLVFPYSKRDVAQRVADALSARALAARQERERVALADAKRGSLPCPALGKTETFSVLLVKAPMEDGAPS